MKKLLAFVLAMVMLFSFVGCGNSNEVEETNINNFEEEYSRLFLEINTTASRCNELSNMIYDIWSIVGTDLAPEALAYMLSLPRNFDEYWENGNNYYNHIECEIGDAYGWLNNSSYGISFDADAEEFHSMCITMQDLYSEIDSFSNDFKEEMRTFRTDYAETNVDDFNLLNDYYIGVSSFVDFSLNPSGSLLSYKNNISEYNEEMMRLARTADIFYLL